MTDHIDDGWLWLSNGSDYLKVQCEHILITPVFGPEIEHYEGGINIGFDLGKFWVVIKGIGIWLETNTKYENFITYIKLWQQARTLQVEVLRNSSEDKLKLDGTNIIYPVLVVGPIGDEEKMPGDQQKFRIDKIILEQSGAAS